jgi:hypothetical protein
MRCMAQTHSGVITLPSDSPSQKSVRTRHHCPPNACQREEHRTVSRMRGERVRIQHSLLADVDVHVAASVNHRSMHTTTRPFTCQVVLCSANHRPNRHRRLYEVHAVAIKTSHTDVTQGLLAEDMRPHRASGLRCNPVHSVRMNEYTTHEK